MQENKDIKKQKRKQKNLELTATLNPNKVNLLNIWKKYPKKVLWMFVSAFLYNIAIAVFLKSSYYRIWYLISRSNYHIFSTNHWTFLWDILCFG